MGLNFQAAIFDLDGTLLDSAALWRELPNTLLRRHGIQPEAGLAGKLADMSLREGVTYFIDRYCLNNTAESLMAECHEIIADAYRYSLPLMPYAEEYLQLLQSLQVKMCIATASDHALAEAALIRCGVRDYFSFIITEEAVGKSKCYPDIYLQAARQLAVPVSDCVVLEDAPHAIETAGKAGFAVYGIGVTTDYKALLGGAPLV